MTSKLMSLVRSTAGKLFRPYYEKLRRYRWPHYCPVCGNKAQLFAPLPAFYSEQLTAHGSDLNLHDFETLNLGAYTCVNCGASDRDRLYALYLAKRLEHDPGPTFRLLDLAPAAALSRHILRNFRVGYRTADLYMDGVDDRVDITHMDCYPDQSFDAFICSHVLEHIPDDTKAMAELFRILKPGGWGIAMVPINLALPSVREDLPSATVQDRWKYYGQDDHARVYTGDGFKNRLRASGFHISEITADFFDPAQFDRCGISEKSRLYVVEKLL